MSGKPSSAKFELALLLVVVIWGINFPATKFALNYISPLTFNAIRFSISVLFLGGLLYRESKHVRPHFERSVFGWLGLLGLGLLGHFAYQVFYILGLDLTSSGNCAFLVSTSPIWTAVVGAISAKDRIPGRAWIGLVLAFLGASVLIFGRTGFDFGDAMLLGNVISFLAAIGWGTFTAFSGRFLDRHSPTGLAFWTMLGALPFLWLIALPNPDAFGGIAEPVVWAVLVYSGILSTGVAYILWNVGIRRVGPSHTAVFANLVPAVAFVIGMLWLGESGTIYELAGAIAILSGLYVMRRQRSGG